MRNKILIADTDEASREILTEVFEDEYEVCEFEKGSKALEIIMKEYSSIAAVIMDMDIDDMTAVEILEKIGKAAWFDTIPFIVLSADFSLKNEKAVVKAGATDFKRKPFDSAILKKKVKKYIDLYTVNEKLIAESEKVAELEAKLKKGSSGGLKDGVRTSGYSQSDEGIVEFIGRLVEFRNPENVKHIKRMKGLVKIMGLEMIKLFPEYKLTPEKVDIIVSASAIHDIGKTAIPDAVLLKPGRFTNEEYEYMKSHTLRGVELLDEFKGVWDEEYNDVLYKIVRSHHEKYDGGGYPDGLKGDAIPIEAQLISIADTYDALVNDKVYKKAYPKDVAFNMINVGDCGVFPPKILECFKKCREKWEAWEEGDQDITKIS